MFICDCCGRVFEEPVEIEDSRGECFGFPSYELMLGCPYCGGSYQELEEEDEY